MRQIFKSFILTLGATTASLAMSLDGSHQPEEGIIDAPMKMKRKDGREIDTMSPFEMVRQASETHIERGHTMLASSSKGFDINMDMVWDWNHVVELKLDDNPGAWELIPNTHLPQVVMVHEQCKGCFSSHNAHWLPNSVSPENGAKTQLYKMIFTYYYMMDVFLTKTEGFFWKTKACLGDGSNCASELTLYAIQIAQPYFKQLGDGYLGLAPMTKDPKHKSFLEQMYDQGMIKEKIFGVHTHMWNSTEAPSQIRFGGYNKELFKEGHDQVWLETRGPNSWEVPFTSAGFHEDDIWQNTHAMINPAYPWISLPVKPFEKFIDDVIKAYPEEQVTCDHFEWCYFVTPCDKLRDRIPTMKFNFPVKMDGETKSMVYEIPNTSLLYDDVDPRINMPICHLAVVKQSYNDVDHFILGQAFMENFYVTYDASNSDKLRIGLSQEVPLTGSSSSGNGGLITLIVVIVAVVTIAVALAVFYTCMKKRREYRLEQAKNYFETLKVKDEENSEETAEVEAFIEDEAPADGAPSGDGVQEQAPAVVQDLVDL